MDIGERLEQEAKRAGMGSGERTKDTVPGVPVWSGPNGQGHNGGITFSLLSRFLCCRERFRLLVVEGLKTGEGFNHRLEYGNMWHTCEEAYAQSRKDPTVSKRWKESVNATLTTYAQKLYQDYPLSRDEIEKWYEVCKLQFPFYVNYWDYKTKQRGTEHRVSLPGMQEKVFDMTYNLPSGRTVRLKGKWDSVDLVGIGRNQHIELMENKTKGDIVPEQIIRQLTFDLQTMLYLVTLRQHYDSDDSEYDGSMVQGVLYNVVRRPLSGGKGTIVRHKAKGSKPEEAKSDYYRRVAQYIANEPEHYFMRWQVSITQEDIIKFKRECLDPILEQLCDWWTWINLGKDPFHRNLQQAGLDVKAGGGVHFRYPYGIYNPLTEGKPTELDEYLYSGSRIGLKRTNNLFPELGTP